jgi:hypothetical protein
VALRFGGATRFLAPAAFSVTAFFFVGIL